MSPTDAEMEDLERRAHGGLLVVVCLVLLVALLGGLAWYLFLTLFPQ